MKVKILDKKFIPGVGLGPFDQDYIEISSNLYKQLIQLGFVIVEEPIIKENYNITNAKIVLNATTEIEDEVEDIPNDDSDIVIDEDTEVDEDIIEENEVEDIPNDEYSEKQLEEMTNKELKEIIENMDLELPKKPTKSNLIHVILNEELE